MTGICCVVKRAVVLLLHLSELMLSAGLHGGLTSAVVTVSELRAQRRRGWGRVGRPDWEKWWLSALSEVTPGLTGTERQTQSGVPLQYVDIHDVHKLVHCTI